MSVLEVGDSVKLYDTIRKKSGEIKSNGWYVEIPNPWGFFFDEEPIELTRRDGRYAKVTVSKAGKMLSVDITGPDDRKEELHYDDVIKKLLQFNILSQET